MEKKNKFNENNLRELWSAFSDKRLSPESYQRIKSAMLSEFENPSKLNEKRQVFYNNSLLNQLTLRPMIPIIIAILLIVGGTGTAVAADHAKPGDALYGLDRALERTQLNFTLTDTGKAKLLTELAKEREQEREQLQQENKTAESEQAAQNTNQALQNAIQVINHVQEEHQDRDQGKSSDKLTEVEDKLTEIQQRFTEQEQERVENKLQNQIGGAEIEATIKNGQTEIKAKVAGQEYEYTLDSTDKNDIINSIHEKTGLSIDDIAAILKIETEDSSSDSSPIDDSQEEETNDDSINSNANINTNSSPALNINSDLEEDHPQNDQNSNTQEDSTNEDHDSENNGSGQEQHGSSNDEES